MPDPLALLPLPLPIFILNDLEDLASLQALLVASPSTYHIFNVHYTEILSCILPHYPPHLLQLLRIILSIRSQPAQIRAQCSPSMQAFDAFRAATILDKDNNADTAPLSKSTTTPAAARSLAKTAAQVQGLMRAFFETLFKRVNAVKPHCPRNKSKGVGFRDQWTPLPNKEFVPYKIIPFEEPSWIEEQRVLRALWRIVVFIDLQAILAPVWAGKDCGAQDEDALDSIHTVFRTQGLNSLWSAPWLEVVSGVRGINPEQLEEMECVMEFLIEVTPSKSSPPARSTEDEHPPQQLQRLPNIEATDHYRVLLQPPPRTGDQMARLWAQAVSDLDFPTHGYRFSHGAPFVQAPELIDLRRGYEMGESLFAYEFKSLRRLGMVFWDGEKLVRLGLNDINHLPTEIKASYLLGPPRGPRKKPRTEGPREFELVVRWRSLFIGHTS
ncbi:MAG: hypothetical protein L6R42_003137 [Xanthoria sp. 1 TBL-2021]|nr:MAG: hypothetical protein L6R42_003137 [Xanthoria sp. 1 TBL-2021]